MPLRSTPFVNGSYYHVYNRGVEKRKIFSNNRDYERFLETLYYYSHGNPKPKFSTLKRFKLVEFEKNPKIIDIACYCLMPNHFHLLIKQQIDGGIQTFMRKILDSYTRYYNTKHRRVGHLFQGTFKAMHIETDEQLLHISRYIHINPYVSSLVKILEDFEFSSYRHFLGITNTNFCNKELILESFGNSGKYKEFIDDHIDYAQTIERIKHTLIDPEE
ncbi:MAG: hypothetical protein G01um10145_237 [Microgenomates group bacterium Gr01-1014_5]|nr:MAG: hypothetical protein G01um10145_237 [Microgenomates group bacterium Gr01-1014_5]